MAYMIDVMMYTDDSQLCTIIKWNNHSVALDQLEFCIDDVLCWNTQNGLKCGPSKTQKSFTSTLALPPVTLSHTSESALLLSNH